MITLIALNLVFTGMYIGYRITHAFEPVHRGMYCTYSRKENK